MGEKEEEGEEEEKRKRRRKEMAKIYWRARCGGMHTCILSIWELEAGGS